MSHKEARTTPRSAHLALAAARQAMDHAGLAQGMLPPERFGIVINTGGGGIGEIQEATETMLKRGPRAVSPFMVPRGMPNAPAAAAAMILQAKGPVLTSTLACASGNYAFIEAGHMLRRGEADVILAGGTESVMATVYMAGLARMQALTKWQGDPALASRPFDKNRDGFVFGEGAAVLALETEAHARQRGATIYGEVLGGWLTADAYHVTAPDPDGDGAARAMSGAVHNAGLEIGDVDVIFAHGTSTPLNDAVETKAIKRTFGERAYDIPISATKSMIGHTMGAAGAISAVAAVYGMRDSLVPPTINYTTPDPDCDLDYVPNKARPIAYRTAMINAFGFGGHNVAVLLGRYHGDS